jgi:hypothetical protein
MRFRLQKQKAEFLQSKIANRKSKIRFISTLINANSTDWAPNFSHMASFAPGDPI